LKFEISDLKFNSLNRPQIISAGFFLRSMEGSHLRTGILLWCLWGLVLSPGHSVATADENADPDLVWLTNDHVRVGLKKSSGGAVFWISPAGSDKSLINSFDRGRLVQQSWYGQPDGSFWNKQPWRWNPVQGGDWKGKSSTILDQKHEPTTSWVRTTPVHWASGEDLKDCVMEQTVTLQDSLIHIRFRFEYLGQQTHPAHHQELPAVFVDSAYSRLAIYEGTEPWTGAAVRKIQPTFPNQYAKIPEHWAAYVNDQDVGIGCYVPRASELTYYRHDAKRPGPANCSYFAPISTLAVVPGFSFEYDVWITLGQLDEIRQRFQALHLSDGK
jgi:hypothetical protein